MMGMTETRESADESGMIVDDDDGMSEMSGMWRLAKRTLCVLCGSLVLTTSLFGVDITMYGFVPEGAHLTKEAPTDEETVAAFKVDSNFEQGVTVTVDLFSKRGEVTDRSGIQISSYIDLKQQQSVTVVSISKTSDVESQKKAKRVIDGYVGDWKMEVRDTEAKSSSYQTLRLTVSESE